MKIKMLHTLTVKGSTDGGVLHKGVTYTVEKKWLVRSWAVEGRDFVVISNDPESTTDDPKSTPNRLKFASLVSKLDPRVEGYAEQVASLNEEYKQRELLISTLRRLVRILTSDFSRTLSESVTESKDDFEFDLTPKPPSEYLLDTLDAAIERFVVDRY